MAGMVVCSSWLELGKAELARLKTESVHRVYASIQDHFGHRFEGYSFLSIRLWGFPRKVYGLRAWLSFLSSRSRTHTSYREPIACQTLL
jgi:hypothetical protein